MLPAIASSPVDTSSYPVRKHIIVAVDGSGSFYTPSADKPRKEIEKFVLELLEKNKIRASGNRPRISLSEDNSFYDPRQDVLSLYEFGITQSDRLKMVADNHAMRISGVKPSAEQQDEAVGKFTQSLLHPYRMLSPGNDAAHTDLKHLVRELFNKDGEKYEVTYSQLIYPLILDKATTGLPAKEIVFLFVSDFKSGSYASSINDWANLKRDALSENLPVYNHLNSYVRKLNDQFYKIDYFSYTPEEKDGLPALFAYKVKPMVGNVEKDNVTISIESDLDMTEIGKAKFRFAPLNIKFNHDTALLNVDDIWIEVGFLNGKELYKARLAQRNGKGKLALVDGGKNVKYDPSHSYYEIPAFSLEIPELTTSTIRDKVVKVNLIFDGTMKKAGSGNIRYAFTAQRELSDNAIHFIEYDKRRNLAIFWTIFIILILTTALLIMGRKKVFKYKKVGHFAQKYVDITPQKGTIELPCWFFKPGGADSNSIRIEGAISKKFPFALSFDTRLYVRLQQGTPAGFKYYIDGKAADDFISVTLRKGRFAFNLNVQVTSPQLLKTQKALICNVLMDYKISSSILGLFKLDDVSEPEKIEFFFMRDLGRAWVGLDPGTTGSCVAYGNTGGTLENPNIRLMLDEVYHDEEIIPSRLVLKNLDKQNAREMEPGKDYDFGVEADQKWIANKNAGRPTFESIKKLLGYKNKRGDLITARLKGKEMQFSGVELAYLLVKGLKSNLDNEIRGLSEEERIRYAGQVGFPQRAVVAIPNNYTLPKITDMVKSVRMLNTFDEVRYIYEAEGVLFYYLKNEYRNHIKERPKEENIMVYDMGGATINITIFKIVYDYRDGELFYDITTLARIGYAVGGDNIDVALMEYVFNLPIYERTLSQKDNHNIELEHKDAILPKVVQLKKNIVGAYNYLEDGSAVPNANMIANDEIYRNAIIDISMVNKGGKKLHGKYSEADSNGNMAPLPVGSSAIDRIHHIEDSEQMMKYVYYAVRDAVEEILKYPGVASLQGKLKVIFSGRSTMFPRIKENVNGVLAKNFGSKKCEIYRGLDSKSIKTAVAEGACWYGIYNSLVTLDNSRLSSAYGYKITEKGDSHLNILMDQNEQFDEDNSISRQEMISRSFASDGNVVDFYQVMGSGYTTDIFSDGNRHKVNYLGSIDVTTTTRSISMTVDRQNKVVCMVEFETGATTTISDLNVTGRDITKENDWAYVFHTLEQSEKNKTVNKTNP